MYKLTRRRNLLPFLVLIGLGLAASIMVPPRFPELVCEIPAFALFPAELALVMILSVLFFENATPAELLRLSFSMFAVCMLAGGVCNFFCHSSQSLPDQTLLVNWVQLACMNATGILSTIAFYQTKSNDAELKVTSRQNAVREGASKQAAAAVGESTATATEVADKSDAASGESAKDILGKLDVDRINNLESALHPESANSLESLFADEGRTASAPKAAKSGSLNDLLGGGDSSPGFILDDVPTNELSKPEPMPIAPPKPEPVQAVEPPKPEIIPVLDDSPIDIGMDIGMDIGLDDLDLMGTKPAAEAPAPIAPAPSKPDTSKNSKLFDDVSADLDDIFSNLAAPEAQETVSPQTLAEIKPTPATEPAPAAKTGGNLFDDVSADIEDIFKSLAPEEAQRDVADVGSNGGGHSAPPAGGGDMPPPADVKPREVKEFGRLSAAATAKTELTAPGTLKTIGQMLLDTHAIENIIKRSEAKGDSAPSMPSAATAKVVSVSRGADIQAMLNKISSYPGVNGCLVIGKDGLLIGATDSLGMMRDVLGVLALGIHSTTNLGTKKIDMGDLRQAVMRTGEKVTVLTEIGIGVLATFCDQWNLSALDGMLDHIGRTVMDSQASGGASLPMESLTGSLLSQASEPAPAPPQIPAAPAAAAAPPDVEAVVSMSDSKGGLLNVSDDDLGGLFDNVLADPTVQHDALGAAQAAPAEPQPAATAAAPGPTGKPVLNVSDEEMTDLFDNLLEKPDGPAISMDFTPEPEKQTAPAAEAAPPPAEVAEPKKENAKGQKIKEFGRLSAPTATNQQGAQEGSIKAIGRQLIDVQAVENIIKSGERREKMGAGLTTARVISAARGEGIKALLTKIDGCPGVKGSLIVGNDGLVIASTLTGGLDKDLLGALCNAMHSHTDLAAKKLQMGKLRQIIFHAEDKVTILTGVAVGVLAVFVENHEVGQIDSLLTAIESTVRG